MLRSSFADFGNVLNTGKDSTARECLYDDTVNDCTTDFIDAKVQDGLRRALERACLGWKVGEWRCCRQRWAPCEDHTEMMYLPADVAGGPRSCQWPQPLLRSKDE